MQKKILFMCDLAAELASIHFSFHECAAHFITLVASSAIQMVNLLLACLLFFHKYKL